MADISKYLESMGATFRRGALSGWQKIRCPFHHDQIPSATVNVVEDRFFCFVCGISEDTIGLIMREEGLGFAEAREKAEKDFGAGDGQLREQSEPGGLLPPRKGNRVGNRRRGSVWRGRFA